MSKVRYGTFVTTAQPEGATEGEIFADTMALTREAERLGFSDLWTLEHHFTRFGLCPDSLTLAAYMLGATSTIDIGTAVVVVPLDHPVRLAERVAMIDHLSNGRLRLGIGRGDFTREFEVLGKDIGKSHLMLQEGWEILRNLWAGPYESDGEFWPFGSVNILPKPSTTPHPPVYVAGSSPSTVEWAAKNGLPLLLLYYLTDEMKRSIVDLYAEVTRSLGRDPLEVRHALSCVAHAADTTEQAQDDVRDTYLWWAQQGNFAQGKLPDHPERREVNYAFHYASRDDGVLRGVRKQEEFYLERLYTLNPIGSVDLCVERITAQAELLGVHHFICGFEGVRTKERIMESMRRFMSEVVPRVDERLLASVHV
jgi:alkanal monooxygenase alpha chain